MKTYGDVAEKAVELITAKSLPAFEAWKVAAKFVFPQSVASQEKGCPRSAFLGLCAAGIVRGVPAGDYGKSGTGPNAQYALAAAEIVRSTKNVVLLDKDFLWKQVLSIVGAEAGKVQNHQMEVVLRLAAKGLLT